MATDNDPVWEWSPEEIVTHYKQGYCHVLAAALSDLTGLPMGIMWNPFEWQVEPDEEGLGGVHELVHIYLVEPEGTVIDIAGSRTLEEMKRDMAEHDWEVCPTEPLTPEVFSALINDSGNLPPFDRDEMTEALEVAKRSPALLAAIQKYIPAWDGPPAPPSPGR